MEVSLAITVHNADARMGISALLNIGKTGFKADTSYGAAVLNFCEAKTSYRRFAAILH